MALRISGSTPFATISGDVASSAPAATSAGSAFATMVASPPSTTTTTTAAATRPKWEQLASPQMGPLSTHEAANTLGHLVATLNAQFPDYDFSACTGPESFTRVPLDEVRATVGAALAAGRTLGDAPVVQLWAVLDKEVSPRNCDVYSFLPPPDADPFAETEGVAWALVYLFYNRALKRVALFTLRCQRGVDGFRSLSTTPMDDDDLQFAADPDDDMV